MSVDEMLEIPPSVRSAGGAHTSPRYMASHRAKSANHRNDQIEVNVTFLPNTCMRTLLTIALSLHQGYP